MENLENKINGLEMGITASKTSQIERINEFIALYEKGELTRGIVYEWLNSLPESERDRERYELEKGIAEDIDNLPK